jgi:hypothetical protein
MKIENETSELYFEFRNDPLANLTRIKMFTNLMQLTQTDQLRNEGLSYCYALMGLEHCKKDFDEVMNKERDYLKSKLEAGIQKIKASKKTPEEKPKDSN